jgi:GNAT superfamily N-acetyltransferase
VTAAVRDASARGAAAVAAVWWRARHAAVPVIPAPVHDEADVRRWVAEVLIPDSRTWVAVVEERVVAMMSLRDGWVDQLYVDPAWQGHGVGTLLVDFAKRRSPSVLDLWTFQANAGARRFYERHGFAPVEWTDGDNEEGAPDVRYHWPGHSTSTPRTSPSSSAHVVRPE